MDRGYDRDMTRGMTGGYDRVHGRGTRQEADAETARDPDRTRPGPLRLAAVPRCFYMGRDFPAAGGRDVPAERSLPRPPCLPSSFVPDVPRAPEYPNIGRGV